MAVTDTRYASTDCGMHLVSLGSREWRKKTSHYPSFEKGPLLTVSFICVPQHVCSLGGIDFCTTSGWFFSLSWACVNSFSYEMFSVGLYQYLGLPYRKDNDICCRCAQQHRNSNIPLEANKTELIRALNGPQHSSLKGNVGWIWRASHQKCSLQQLHALTYTIRMILDQL